MWKIYLSSYDICEKGGRKVDCCIGPLTNEVPSHIFIRSKER